MATNHQWHVDRENFRALLDTRRRQIADDLQLRMARIRENGSNAKPTEEPDDPDSRDLDVMLVEIATTTLRRIEEAIERLDDGEYGLCARCSGPIEAARLRALPFAVCCRQCESLREREAVADRAADRKRHAAWDQSPAADELRIGGQR
jgi:DnaK suppressor protein